MKRITTQYSVNPRATAEKIENTFKHHPPFGDQTERYNLLRENAKAFAYLIVALTPPSTEQARALSHLDEAVASANMAIARHEAPKPDQPEGELSEHAGGDPIPKRNREPNVIPA